MTKPMEHRCCAYAAKRIRGILSRRESESDSQHAVPFRAPDRPAGHLPSAGAPLMIALVLSALPLKAAEPTILERPTFTMHRPNAAQNPGDGPWAMLTLSNDDQWLAGGGTQFAVWNANTGKVRQAADALKQLDGVAFSPDGETVVGWSLAHGTRTTNRLTPIQWWPGGGKQSMRLQIDAGPAQEILAAGFSSDGKTLLTIAPDRSTRFAAKAVPMTFNGLPMQNLYTFAPGEIVAQADSTAWRGPAVICRTGTTIAVSDGSHVQIVDALSGQRIAASEVHLGNPKFNAFVAISADGSRSAVVIQANETEGSKLVVFDAKTGKTIATCTGHTSLVAAIALTPDGRWLASGGMDRTARLWDADTGAEIARVSGVRDHVNAVAIRSDGQVIYTGNISGEVQAWSLPTPRPNTTDSPAVAATAMPLDSTPASLPPENTHPVAVVEVPGIAFNRTQEELFLTLAAQRLLDRCVPTGELPIESAEAKQLAARAEALHDYVLSQKFDPRLAQHFAAIPGLLKEIAGEAELRRQQLREHADQVREQMRASLAAKENFQLGLFTGGVLAVLGNLPMYSNRYDPITGTTLTVESGTLSPAISEHGVSVMLQSLSSGLATQENIAAAEAINETVLRRVTLHSYERQQELISRQQSQLDPLLTEQLGGKQLPPLPSLSKPAAPRSDERIERTPTKPQRLSDVLRDGPPKPKPTAASPKPRSPKDFLPLLDAQQQRATLIKEQMGVHDPFTVAEWVGLKSTTQIARHQRSTEWVTLGKQTASLARQLPAGVIYDQDRAELLGAAADLMLRAAMIDAENASWTKLNSDKAEMALTLLHAARRFDSTDATGVLREQQALACALSGRWREAYSLAASLRTVRGDSQRFRFLLARLAFIVGRPSESIEELAIAIERLGLTDIRAVKACLDLPRQESRFKELTEIELEAISRSALVGGSVQVINRSSFPLTNARFQMKHPIRGGFHTSELHVASLSPGEECVIPYHQSYAPDLLPANSQNQDRGKLTLTADQGTAAAVVH